MPDVGEEKVVNGVSLSWWPAGAELEDPDTGAVFTVPKAGWYTDEDLEGFMTKAQPGAQQGQDGAFQFGGGSARGSSGVT
ncbi:MAG: hypothetical protein Q8R28_19050, partial [Dehalococcoidia bacterium]|nr:hypothetical protein [Dehalococcoidia bacterium]